MRGSTLHYPAVHCRTCVSKYSSVRGMSSTDLTPAHTTATGVRPSSVRSAEMSKLLSPPRCTPPMPAQGSSPEQEASRRVLTGSSGGMCRLLCKRDACGLRSLALFVFERAACCHLPFV
jgi:hypothetical protein